MNLDDLYQGKSPTLYCSFCGKSQHEVRKLIAGPTAFICNECVDLSHEIAHEHNDIHRDLLLAAIEARRLLAQFRWHDRLNDFGCSVWTRLESAIDAYTVAGLPAKDAPA